MDPGLDFASLLGIAQHVQKDKTVADVKLLKTKFSGPKKEKREKGKLNSNVKKFLERKEEEERKKKECKKLEAKKLVEQRSDREKNKIAKHLKVTKSANKSVLSEAVNKTDTAHTMEGRQQCDEDDYGYESRVSQNLYEKLMGKYESCPEDPMAKFSKAKPKQMVDIATAMERVKMALKKDEEPQPRTRKRRHKGGEEESEVGINYRREVDGERRDGGERRDSGQKKLTDKEKEKLEASERRKQLAKKAPPPMDFQSLIKMATVVKDKPVEMAKPKKITSEASLGDRPMTKREQEEWRREQERRLRREGKLPPPATSTASSKSGTSSSSSDKRQSSSEKETARVGKGPQEPIPKIRKPEPGPQLHPAVIKSLKSFKERSSPVNPNNGYSHQNGKHMKDRSSSSSGSGESKRRPGEGNNNKDEKSRMVEEYKKLQEKVSEMEERLRLQEEHRKLQEKCKEMEEKLAKSSTSSGKSSSDTRASGGKKRDISQVPARQFPGEKGCSRKEERSKDKSKSLVSSKSRRRIESESEEDSEMDDFIDDSESNIDISKEIRSIFGYDRRKFRDEPDFDDRSMENNKYSSIMMEEVRSAKIGKMEDLADMRREEEEKRRKKIKSKAR